ncbi:MAG: hypothetical protein WCW02_02615 [Candidatus Buchananbacteria bacterium]
MKFYNFFKSRTGWLVVIIAILLIYIIYQQDYTKANISWGVSFSKPYAEQLGLNWRQTYLAILDDLKVNNLRLSNYWSEIEKAPGQYDFKDIDWQLQEADRRGVQVILTLGRRQPRWPECHDPAWLKNFPETESQAKVLQLLRVELEHFKNYHNIKAWQLENEPLLSLFGVCPKPDKAFLAEEYALIQSLDPRPVYLTDSGELSGWFRVASLSDYLGTTMYRIVWNKYLGFWSYHLPPALYRLHAYVVQKLYGQKKIIVTELQAEPWTWKPMKEMSKDEQNNSMNLTRLSETISYAKKTGFTEYYLWGAEWMYWRKLSGDNTFWQETKKLWQPTWR